MRIPFLLFLFLLVNMLPAQEGREDSLQLPNATLYYYTYGEGEPVLILSGGPGLASHQEDDLAKALSKKYRAILFDQRGTGKSWTRPMDSTTINLQVAVEDIERLRLHLNISKLTITGHSWGGMLAAAYVAHYPSHVKKLVLICPGEISPAFTPVVNANIETHYQLADTVKYDYWNDSANIARDPERARYEKRRMIMSTIIYNQKKLDSVMVQTEHGEMNFAMSALMWKSFAACTEDWPAMIRKKYKGEAVIIIGWQDPISQVTLYQHQQAFPRAKTIGINECGHMPSVEQPGQFYKAVFEFLGGK